MLIFRDLVKIKIVTYYISTFTNSNFVTSHLKLFILIYKNYWRKYFISNGKQRLTNKYH